jgi:RNA polymerase sigma-B factor
MQVHDHRTDTELALVHRNTGDSAAREVLILRHAGLVRSIARRFARRGLPYEDIVQSGYLGLIQAVDRFDPDRGVPLQAYAARTIEGEIMHLFRDRGWAVRVPRSLQELSRSLAVVSEQLGHKLGRKPTVAELAQAVSRTEDEVTEALAVQRAYVTEPLNEPGAAGERGNDEDVRPVHALMVDDPGFDLVTDRDELMSAMRHLPTRERAIVRLRFVHDMTQSEIAAEMGISQMHVSRLLRSALGKLHAILEEQGPAIRAAS